MLYMKQSASAAVAACTVLAPVSWGTTYATVTELLPAGRPLLVAAVRVAPAGLVLVALSSVRGRARPRGAAAWGRTSLLAMANFGLFFPLLTVAVYRLPGGVAAAAGGLQPLLVAGLAWPVAGTRPRRRDLLVGAVAALGVALVVLRPGAAFDGVGLAAAVSANLAFATGVVLTRHLEPPADRLTGTGWQLVLAGALLVPLALVVEGPPPAPTTAHLAGYAYLSLAATGLAFVLWFAGIRRLPAAAPPLLGLAAPVTGAAVGWVLVGQALSPVQLIGFLVTVGAIVHGARLSDAGAADAGTGRTGAGGPSEPQAGADRPVVGHDLGHHVGRHDRDAAVDQDVVGLAVGPVGRVGAAPDGASPAGPRQPLHAPPPHVHVARQRGRPVLGSQRGPQCGAKAPDRVLEQGKVRAEHGERCAVDVDDRPHERPAPGVAPQLRGQRNHAGRPHRQA